MKRIALISVCTLLLFSCGEKAATIEQKKESLKTLKENMSELNSQISALQKEIALSDTSAAERGAVVIVQSLEPTSFAHYVDQPGTVTSKENVAMSFEVGGVVRSILVKEGQWVTKGQSLLKLDDAVMANQVEELKVSVMLAETTFNRQKRLWEKGIGSELEFLQYKNQFLSLQSRLDATHAQLQRLTLTAPINGRVDEVYLNVGEFANPGSPALRVVNSKKLQIEVDLAEKYSTSISKGDVVKINFNSIGLEEEAPITFVGQIINPANRTFKVKIDLMNTSRGIKPNAVASLKLKDFLAEEAMVLPSKTIKKDMRGSFVFVAKDGKALKTYIETGKSYYKNTHILSGLNFGDEVIIVGFNEVSNGSTIDIKR
jgi:membrane fusion protein, multidrug efflux system